MRFVIQKVGSASVSVDDKIVSEIGNGLLVLVGLGVDDSKEDFDYFIKKILNMRIFEDEERKMNKSVIDVGGEILLISQFTLYADCKKGNRPSFVKAMSPEKAKVMYEDFVENFKKNYVSEKVKNGVFGAFMKVSLVNDGPVTIVLEHN